MQLENSQSDQSAAELNSSQNNPKWTSEKINLPGWITLAIYLIVGTLALMPGLFPSKTFIPTAAQVKKCTETVRFDRNNIPEKQRIIQTWCSVVASEKKIPNIHLIPAASIKDPTQAAIKKETSKPAYLELDENALTVNPAVLLFTLAHEYQHVNQRHDTYRCIFTAMLWISVVFSIVQLMVFKHATKSNRIAAIFLLPVFTYLACFYSFSEHESQADAQAFIQLQDMNADPANAAKLFIAYTNDFNVDPNPPNPINFLCLFEFEGIKFTATFYNCNPHPSREQRETKLRKKFM
ncbi:MAG: M48 family metalloprotease [Methylophilus sp.]|uniref:M48 family metalloprotease n=1 Tax=Methylophilus sp. TaxID=29541 RepID=UPI003F9F4BEB